MQKSYFLFTIMTLLMVSCSGIPKEREVTVSNVSISGNISSYVKVVDGTYTFTNNGEEAFVTLEFELKQQPYGEIPFVNPRGIPELILQPIDSKGNYIDLGVHGMKAKDVELRKIENLFAKDVGSKVKILFTMPYFDINENSKLLFTDASNFEIIDDAFIYDPGEYEDNMGTEIESNNNNTATSIDEEDFNKLLDSYENYVDQYIKFFKKASKGDTPSAMSEYAILLEKATELSEKLEKTQGQMTSEQLRRYLDITAKFTAGIAEIDQK